MEWFTVVDKDGLTHLVRRDAVVRVTGAKFRNRVPGQPTRSDEVTGIRIRLSTGMSIYTDNYTLAQFAVEVLNLPSTPEPPTRAMGQS